VTRITGMAFLLSILATLYPAWQASRIKPAEELRYE
jgi:lipoprotein-releasing system permease protein